jgi:hypothetical protein
MTEPPAQTDKPPFTHTAWILKTDIIRKGRRLGRWIDEGVARLNPDGSADVFLHSLPIGGFSGHIHVAKIGANPPDLTPAPQRPEATGDDEEDSEE